MQERYDYDPEAAQKFRAQNAVVVDALTAGWSGKGATSKSEAEVELLLPANQDFRVPQAKLLRAGTDHCKDSRVRATLEGSVSIRF